MDAVYAFGSAIATREFVRFRTDCMSADRAEAKGRSVFIGQASFASSENSAGEIPQCLQLYDFVH